MQKRHREETEKKIEDKSKENQQVLERWWIAQYEQSELEQQRRKSLRDMLFSVSVVAFQL